MSPDLVGILEAAYETAADDEHWLRELIGRIRPNFRDCPAIYGMLYDDADLSRIRIDKLIGLDLPAGWEAQVHAVGEMIGPLLFARLFRSGPIATFNERLGDNHPAGKAFLAGLGSQDLERVERLRVSLAGFGADSVGMVASDPSGRSCHIATLQSQVTKLSVGEVELWTRVSAHVAAGHRIRRQLAALDERQRGPDGADAVLRPDGRVEHAAPAAASPVAREALRSAVKALDRARSRLRRTDPNQAVEVWRGLVAGRWSVLDHFDGDGRRFVLARRNDPAARPVQQLSNRECQVIGYAALGHSNKLIAYELGLAASTIANHLSRAAAKLGFDSRVTLIDAVSRLAPQPLPPVTA